VIKAAKHILACLVILSFSAVITADYWRNTNVASIVILEIEPKKSNEKRSDSSNELKQDFKEKLLVAAQASPFSLVINSKVSDRYIEKHSTPHLSSSDLPPELV
jgi:hypothetical protein